MPAMRELTRFAQHPVERGLAGNVLVVIGERVEVGQGDILSMIPVH